MKTCKIGKKKYHAKKDRTKGGVTYSNSCSILASTASKNFINGSVGFKHCIETTYASEHGG